MPTLAPERHIRVFVSSTFRDMQAERDILVKKVFPLLRKMCEERAVTWTEVDLRWGITDEDKAEGKVLPLCLAEVERCRPYFICLLGERYGWLPAAEDVSDELLQAEPWLSDHPESSVTELEIQHGVLRNPSMADRALFYFRDPRFVEHLPDGMCRSDFISESSAAATKLAELKDTVRAEYRAGVLRFAPRENYPGPEALGERVLADFTAIIEQEFPRQAVPDPLDQEAARHEAYANGVRMGFVGRDEELRWLEAHTSGSEVLPVLIGDPGCGKSALLAEWVHRHREAHPKDLIVQHFVGSTPDSASWPSLVRRILGELKREFSFGEDIPNDVEALRHALHEWTGRCTGADRNVVIVLDALEQLADDHAGQQLGWLPAVFPTNVRFVLSALPCRALEVLNGRVCEVKTVPLLRREEVVPAVASFYALYGRRQLPRATQARLERCDAALNPLFLRTVLNELRLCGQHEHLDASAAEYLSAPDLPALFDRVLDRWDTDFGKDPDYPNLVQRALSLIACARVGLSESELLDLLGKNGERLPRRPWTPLYLAAENALTQRFGLIALSHAYLRHAIESRWLKDQDSVRRIREQLIRYFTGQTGWVPRKIEELPWQLARNEDWPRLEQALVSEECFRGQMSKSPFELLSYWKMMPSTFDLEHSYANAYAAWKVRHTEPLLLAELAFGLGVILQTAGQLGAAEQRMRQAVHLAETVLGENHATVGTYLSYLALICMKSHRHQDAHDALDRAMDILRSHHGGDHPSVGSALNNFACLMLDAGQTADGESLCRQALAVAERTLPPTHPDIAARLGNLGLALEALDRLADAETAMRRALGVAEACLGQNNPEVATKLCNLGSLLMRTARFEEAENLVRRALKIDEDTYGQDHMDIATALNNLANVLSSTNRFREATVCLNRALRIEESLGGPNDPAIATTLNNLACLLQNTGHPDEAEPLFRRALDIDRLNFGLVHARVAQRLNNYSTLLRDLSRPEEAEAAIRQAIDIYERVIGANHMTMSKAFTNLGQVLHDQHRLEEAEPVMRRALDICRQQRGPDHPEVAVCLNNISQLMQDLNRLADAEQLMREALKLRQKGRGAHDPEVGLLLNNLAGILVRAGRPDEAEPLYEQAIEIFVQLSVDIGSAHPFLDNTVDNYSHILAERGMAPADIKSLLDRITRPPGPFEPAQYVVILASHGGQSCTSSPEVIAVLEELAGVSAGRFMTRVRFTIFRNNARAVSEAKQGTGIVAMEALALLGSTLPPADRGPLLDRFLSTIGETPVRHVTDSSSGEEYALVAFFDQSFKDVLMDGRRG
jgi:nephrocystin-3